MKEINIENTGVKYSKMLMQLVEQFDELLPETLTFEETLEVGIEAWNLANNKESLGSDLYKKELKAVMEKSYKEIMWTKFKPVIDVK